LNPLVRSSLLVYAFSLGGLALTVLSNAVMAAFFGAGREMDVFFAATTIPMMVGNLLATSLGASFLPIISESRTRGEEEAWRAATGVINWIVIVTVPVSLAGMLWARDIIALVVPGFDAGKAAMAAGMLRWLFPLTVVTCLNEVLCYLCYLHREFLFPSIGKVLTPFVAIVAMILFRDPIGIWSLVAALLVSESLWFALLTLRIRRKRYFRFLGASFGVPPQLRNIVAMMLPLMAANAASRMIPLFDRYFLSGLAEGELSVVGYAFKIFQSAAPLLTAGAAVTLFPVFASMASEKDWRSLADLLAKGVRMMLFLSIPAVFLFWAGGKPVIRVLFERGEFGPAHTDGVFRIVSLYLLAFPATAIGGLIAQGFYVLRNTRIPLLIDLPLIVVYIGSCALLVPRIGSEGIPIAYVIFFNGSVLILTKMLQGLLREKAPVSFPLTRSSGMHLALGALSGGCVYVLRAMIPVTDMWNFAFLALGALFYFTASKYVLNSEEWQFIEKEVLRRFLDRDRAEENASV